MKNKLTGWSKSFFIMLVIELFVFGGMYLCEWLCNVPLGWNFNENNDAFYTLLSLSFIVSSLSSILAERNMPIYWSDVEYEMLIRPRFTNITSLIGYICATIVTASIVNSVKPDYLIWCLLLTISALILLTSKTIMAHFSRNIVKDALKKEFLENKHKKEELTDVTLRLIDENQICYTIENIELLLGSNETEIVNRLLQYAADVNPFLFYKIVDTLGIACPKLLYVTAIRLIDNDNSGALVGIVDECIRQNSQKYVKHYIDGIASIERNKDGEVEFWQFQKARSQSENYIEQVNQTIANDYYSVSNLMIYALIKNNYNAFIHMINVGNAAKENLQDEYKAIMHKQYADDIPIKNLLGFFEIGITKLDLLSATVESKLKEIRFHLIRAMKAHIISNGQLQMILAQLTQLKNEEIVAIAKEESYQIESTTTYIC